MPSLGADMDEGTLLEWLVHPGDTVQKGDVVAVVDTAKAAVEVECFTNGVVEQLLVEPGTTVAVGTPLAVIGAAAPAGVAAAPISVPAPRIDSHPSEPAAVAKAVKPPARHRAKLAATARTEAPGPARQRVSPFARRLAAERGVDLTTIAGTDGTVRARDVRPALETPALPARGRDERMREAIATLMSRSKREIPHYYLRTTIDLHAATQWLREHNRQVPVTDRIVPAALLLAATARAARHVPQVNGFWVDDHLELKESVHLGVAVSLRSGGMVTPAIHDAQALPLVEVMARMRELVERARGGRLRASELTDATLTVTNLGDQGVEEVLGVIYPPQVALVGFGTVLQRPWAVDGLLGVRAVVTATLSADHRATDGYVGARFLDRIDSILQRPEEL
jgi:pyruvate dehydrogenase E2 component (dihydrolipoamide acetyltransferase)